MRGLGRGKAYHKLLLEGLSRPELAFFSPVYTSRKLWEQKEAPWIERFGFSGKDGIPRIADRCNAAENFEVDP